MSLPPEVIDQMADDPSYPRPHKPKPGRPRGRPPGSRPKKGGGSKRAFLNSALYVTQSGERVPVLRMLITLPDSTAAKADGLAAQLGTSVSGLICALVDELPEPKSVPPAPSLVPPEPAGGAGQWRPLWLPSALAGKLARHLARVGWDLHTFVGHMVAAMPDPDLMAKAKPLFAGWEDEKPSPAPPAPASGQ
jgi:hypothetical protein